MRKVMLMLIRVYQRTISVVIPPCCRFYPSCSEYARQAFNKYGFFYAFYISLKRFIKCHPYHPGGYDPLP